MSWTYPISANAPPAGSVLEFDGTNIVAATNLVQLIASGTVQVTLSIPAGGLQTVTATGTGISNITTTDSVQWAVFTFSGNWAHVSVVPQVLSGGLIFSFFNDGPTAIADSVVTNLNWKIFR